MIIATNNNSYNALMTIYALSTGSGISGVAIIRISGPEASLVIKSLTGKERSIIIRRWHDLILENIDDLAMIMTLENGKPIPDSRGEIVYASWFVDWFAEEAKRTYGKTIPETMPGRKILTIKQPIGVCAIITPWNFPAAMITRKVAPALAA